MNCENTILGYNEIELIYNDYLTATQKLQRDLYFQKLWEQLKSVSFYLERLQRYGVLKDVQLLGHPVYTIYLVTYALLLLAVFSCFLSF